MNRLLFRRGRRVPEGIEHLEQATALIGLGCHEGQGFHFYRPLPADDIELLLFRGAIHAHADTASPITALAIGIPADLNGPIEAVVR